MMCAALDINDIIDLSEDGRVVSSAYVIMLKLFLTFSTSFLYIMKSDCPRMQHGCDIVVTSAVDLNFFFKIQINLLATM